MKRMRSFSHSVFLAVAILLSSACSPLSASSLPAGLTVEEHALAGQPTLDPLDFKPLEGTMADITAVHAAERNKTFPDNSLLIDGRFSMRIALGSDTLTATVNYEPSGQAGWVTVSRNETEIYRIDVGMGSPITALRGLWVYDGHWVLETAYITAERVVGKLTRDGELLNASQGYSDAFGFQLMHGRPFYFFRTDARLGFYYDNNEVPAGYDEIPRYGCCSESEVNARQAENMVAFFARRDRTWYYVEIGVFD
jgi:hypothetical protein